MMRVYYDRVVLMLTCEMESGVVTGNGNECH